METVGRGGAEAARDWMMPWVRSAVRGKQATEGLLRAPRLSWDGRPEGWVAGISGAASAERRPRGAPNAGAEGRPEGRPEGRAGARVERGSEGRVAGRAVGQPETGPKVGSWVGPETGPKVDRRFGRTPGRRPGRGSGRRSDRSADRCSGRKPGWAARPGAIASIIAAGAPCRVRRGGRGSVQLFADHSVTGLESGRTPPPGPEKRRNPGVANRIPPRVWLSGCLTLRAVRQRRSPVR